MKKVLSLVICLSLSMFALVGCGTTTEKPAPTTPETRQEAPVDETRPSTENMNGTTKAPVTENKGAESTK